MNFAEQLANFSLSTKQKRASKDAVVLEKDQRITQSKHIAICLAATLAAEKHMQELGIPIPEDEEKAWAKKMHYALPNIIIDHLRDDETISKIRDRLYLSGDTNKPEWDILYKRTKDELKLELLGRYVPKIAESEGQKIPNKDGELVPVRPVLEKFFVQAAFQSTDDKAVPLMFNKKSNQKVVPTTLAESIGVNDWPQCMRQIKAAYNKIMPTRETGMKDSSVVTVRPISRNLLNELVALQAKRQAEAATAAAGINTGDDKE